MHQTVNFSCRGSCLLIEKGWHKMFTLKHFYLCLHTFNFDGPVTKSAQSILPLPSDIIRQLQEQLPINNLKKLCGSPKGWKIVILLKGIPCNLFVDANHVPSPLLTLSFSKDKQPRHRCRHIAQKVANSN